MINLNRARARSTNRIPTPSDKTASAQTKSYINPLGGLVTSQQLAAPGDLTAIILDNFFVTTRRIEPRGGSLHRVNIPNPVTAMFQYRGNGAKTYFATDTTHVYEFSDSTPNETTLSPSITGQTSGDYSALEMQTDGGTFLTIVNGSDRAQIYDGTAWQQISDISAPFAITGVDTSRLSHIWAYRNRQFFIERGTMSAWYLGINSVAGPALEIPLAGVFQRGGSLFFGATWSSDSGAGFDDRCVFATDQGEFCVFNGADPSEASSWSLEGVYDLGRPLGRNAMMTVGGDLLVATEAGLIPISAAVRRDVAELKLEAVTRPISSAWENEISIGGTSTAWNVVKWSERNMALVCPPQQLQGGGYCYVVNLENGRWSRFTGWSVGSMEVLGGELHYGGVNGRIYQCEVGGTDDGALIECRACFAFDDLGSPGAIKVAHAIRGGFEFRVPIIPRLSVATNYVPNFPPSPSSIIRLEDDEGIWDLSEWDQALWAEGDNISDYQERWQSVSGHGRALAVQIQLVSSAPYKLDCGVVTVDLVYSTGAVLT